MRRSACITLGLVLTLDLDMFVMVDKVLHCFRSVKAVKADLWSVYYIHSLNSNNIYVGIDRVKQFFVKSLTNESGSTKLVWVEHFTVMFKHGSQISKRRVGGLQTFVFKVIIIFF